MGTQDILSANLKEIVLEVNGHKHALPLVLAKAGSCPLVEFNVSELDVGTIFEFTPFDETLRDLNLVVYKHAGKILIVVGSNHVVKAIEKGQAKIAARLLTSVALKNARTVTTSAEPPFNPPRLVESNLRASAGPSHERTRTADHIRSDHSRPQHSTPRTFSAGGPNSSTRQSFGKPSQPKKRFA